MTFEGFRKADSDQLTAAAKELFDRARAAPYPFEHVSEWYQEAQFFMSELDRRENDKVANRDRLLELIIIWLIVAELALSLLGIGLEIREGRDENMHLERIENAIRATRTQQ